MVKSRNVLTRDLSVCAGPVVFQSALHVLRKTIEALLLIQTGHSGNFVFLYVPGYTICRHVRKIVFIGSFIHIGVAACTKKTLKYLTKENLKLTQYFYVQGSET